MNKSDATKNKQKDVQDDPAVGLLFLAVSDERFQQKVKEFRKKYSIEPPFIMQSDDDPKNVVDAVCIGLGELMEEFKLPQSSSMRYHLWNYITYNKIGIEEIARYQIAINPIVVIDRKGKILTYASSVSLVTYAKLSPEEERQALKSLRSTQKWALHPTTLRSSRALRHVRANLEIEKAMESKINPHIDERYSSYVDIVYKNFLAGKMTLGQFVEAKKDNPRDVKKIKVGHTSKDVAKKKFGNKNKHTIIRQRIRRLKNLRKEFFGHQL